MESLFRILGGEGVGQGVGGRGHTMAPASRQPQPPPPPTTTRGFFFFFKISSLLFSRVGISDTKKELTFGQQAEDMRQESCISGMKVWLTMAWLGV